MKIWAEFKLQRTGNLKGETVQLIRFNGSSCSVKGNQRLPQRHNECEERSFPVGCRPHCAVKQAHQAFNLQFEKQGNAGNYNYR